MGTGTLNSIIGNIGNGTIGADVYSIIIPNTTAFSASFASYTAGGATGETDAFIYLFDSTGHSVETAAENAMLGGFSGTEASISSASLRPATLLSITPAASLMAIPAPAAEPPVKALTKSLSAVRNTLTLPNPLPSPYSLSHSLASVCFIASPHNRAVR